LHRDELNAIEDETARQRRLVELNVIEQCLNIYDQHIRANYGGNFCYWWLCCWGA
jgi:hypothetical protein